MIANFLGRPPFNRIFENMINDPVFIIVYVLILGVVIVELIRISLKLKKVRYKKTIIILYVILAASISFVGTGLFMIKF